MRAMGSGSVSSLLKIALDVVHYAACIIAVAFLIAAVAALILPTNLVATSRDGDALTQVELTGPMLAAGLAVRAVYTGVLILIVGRLRRIFATLSAGDPFHPDNVVRLRMVGLGLAGLAGLNLVLKTVGGRFLPDLMVGGGGWFDLTAWFSVLVVFVLAEVFREGARLRREAELTI